MQRFTPPFAFRNSVFSACAAAMVLLCGCSNMPGTALPGSVAVPLSRGSVHGGQQAIQGSHIYLYGANTAGYGSTSTSLMTPGAPGTTTDTNNNAYVTTDVNGSFSFGGAYSCTSGTQVYLLALGGNPGLPGNAQNGAIGLSAALGDCAGLNSSGFTYMNEVTTVAMVYALSTFMIDPTHVGSSSTNVSGLKTAFATVNNLVNNTTGTALTTTPGGNGTAPQQYVNTLASIIASCVNSSSGSSMPCTQLFSSTTVHSVAPPDTLSALINIAAFPGAQTANLYALVPGAAAFQPSLGAQPNDFALGITYTPAVSVNKPGTVVIDKAGNVWMANCQSCSLATATDSLIEYGADGTFLHSYSNAGVHNTQGIAIDAGGTYIYSINQGVSGSTHPDDQLTKMSIASGALQSGFPVDFNQGTYGVNAFEGIAIDNSGEIWATATTAGAILEMDPSGTSINGSPFYVGGTVGVGADNAGNIWFAGLGGNNILQFNSSGNYLNNYTPSGLNQPVGVALNSSNEIWSINNGSQSLSGIESNGSNGSGSPYSIGLYQAAIVAIDGANQVLIPNCRMSCPGLGATQPDNLLRLSASGAYDTGGSGSSGGAQIPSFSGIGGAAVDASGNVWVSNSVSGTVTEVIGFAAPTVQPLAAASAAGTIGQLP